MLVVTGEALDLDTCFEHAARVGLQRLDTWGPQGGPAQRVFGYLEGLSIELVWWPIEFAETSFAAPFEGEPSSTADALVHGASLRTSGLLARWQQQLADYPDELAAERIESGALTWRRGTRRRGCSRSRGRAIGSRLSAGWWTTRRACCGSSTP
jgi:hypothetical protein